jgi:hypothetical protein
MDTGRLHRLGYILRRLAVFLFAVIAVRAQPSRILTVAQAEKLALNTPDVLKSNHQKRCPKPDSVQILPTIVWIQVWNTCPVSGNGHIGNYVVDLSTGAIFADVDQTIRIKSRRLNSLRRDMLRASPPR